MEQLVGKADLHIHTKHSDGNHSVDEVLRYVAEHTDLNLIAITDHDTISGALEAARLAPSYGVEVIVGEEISTAQGHLLALFLERPVAPGQHVEDTIAQVHDQGGLCIAAHPFGMLVPSIGRSGMRRSHVPLDALGLDGIEGLNASLWNPYNNALAQATAEELDLACCGGSDSHHLTTIGSGYTVFPGKTASDLRHAVERRLAQPAGGFWGWTEVAAATVPFIRRELRWLARRALLPTLR